MEQRESDVERDPVTSHVHEHRSVTIEDPGVPPESSEVVSTFNPGWRAVQGVYLVFGVLDGLLLIRIILKLLGANPQAAFSSWLYAVTNIFLAPFKNMLPTIGDNHSQLEVSVVIAILVYALLGWALTRLVTVAFYRNVTVAQRSGRLRPRGF